jgi:enoyl-[acyl-carrier protein] reductase II
MLEELKDIARKANPRGLTAAELRSRLSALVGTYWSAPPPLVAARPPQCDTNFLGSRYPIMGGAMTWVSEHRLVAAISNGGGFGVLAGGALTAEELDREISAARNLTDQPFGVNIVTFAPHYAAQLECCLDHRVSHLVIGGGVPAGEQIAAAKRAGVKIMAFAASLAMAERAIRHGVDALIAEGREAGGHVGPLATSVLVQELFPVFGRVPVFIAGGIGRGEMIAHYLRLGAAGCQLGTRFVCASESRVHPRTKAAYLKASGRDAALSVQVDPEFKVIPVRALVNKASREFVMVQRDAIHRYRGGELSRAEVQGIVEKFWAGSLRRAVLDGDVERGSLMAGQSVEFLRQEQSAAEIIAELVAQAGGWLGAVSHFPSGQQRSAAREKAIVSAS